MACNTTKNLTSSPVMLAPYAGRDEAIGQQLPSQRKKLLELLIGKINIEKLLSYILQLFRNERNGCIRKQSL